jgi:ABC-type amino acid transport substrate-binding protein
LTLVQCTLVTIALATILASVASAQTTNSPAAAISSAGELIIGTKEAPPLSVAGISIELSRRVAGENDLHYRFAEETNVQNLLDGLLPESTTYGGA